MKSEVFLNPDANPTALVVTHAMLGDCLQHGNGAEGDHSRRSSAIASLTGQYVLAYDRFDPSDYTRTFVLGLPRALDPPDYTKALGRQAERITKDIEELRERLGGLGTIIFAASSAGAGHQLGLVATEKIEPDVLISFDPCMTQNPRLLPRVQTLCRWSASQIVEAFKQAQHPDAVLRLPSSNLRRGASNLSEMSYFSLIYSGDLSRRVLSQIAAQELLRGMRARLVIPQYTFTHTAREGSRFVDELNSHNNSQFLAEYIAGAFHSNANDPYTLAHLVNEELHKRQAASARALALGAIGRFGRGGH